MTTSAQTERPSITKAEIRDAVKKLLPFSVNKIGEGIFDMFITAIIVGITLAWLATMQDIPVTSSEVSAYIITGFILYLFLRITQDFDDHYTTDELGDEIIIIKGQLADIRRLVRNDNKNDIADDELNERLNMLEK